MIAHVAQPVYGGGEGHRGCSGCLREDLSTNLPWDWPRANLEGRDEGEDRAHGEKVEESGRHRERSRLRGKHSTEQKARGEHALDADEEELLTSDGLHEWHGEQHRKQIDAAGKQGAHCGVGEASCLRAARERTAVEGRRQSRAVEGRRPMSVTQTSREPVRREPLSPEPRGGCAGEPRPRLAVGAYGRAAHLEEASRVEEDGVDARPLLPNAQD